jgi:hypothetical protein
MWPGYLLQFYWQGPTAFREALPSTCRQISADAAALSFWLLAGHFVRLLLLLLLLVLSGPDMTAGRLVGVDPLPQLMASLKSAMLA